LRAAGGDQSFIMNPLTKSEKDKILKRLFWDIEISQTDLDEMLDKNLNIIDEIHAQQFFNRLLTSCDWYTLLKLLPPAKLIRVLNDSILETLFPESLKKKYIYARDLLSRFVIPTSG